MHPLGLSFHIAITLKKFFYSSVVALQCCVNFHCTAKWLSYTYIFFFIYFPFWFVIGYWLELLVLYSRTLLFIHPRYSSLHLLIPSSQPFPPPPSPTWQLQVCSLCLWMFHGYVHLYHILNSTCKWYYMVFVFFCLTYFTRHNTSKSIHAVANSTISFFL